MIIALCGHCCDAVAVEDCPACGGPGCVEIYEDDPQDGYCLDLDDCEYCEGTGEVCEECLQEYEEGS